VDALGWDSLPRDSAVIIKLLLFLHCYRFIEDRTDNIMHKNCM